MMFSLAEYAVSEASSCAREHPEKEHQFRTPFQRDRDRIIHSKAFRRLEYKTQVFVNHMGDHFRTRLTHSIEVSQISRSVARSLRLNEDLVETLALAHDLGHPPFGHAGERALHQLMRSHGGFNHNEQTFRLLTQLEERYPKFPGLNLTQAARLGLQKHDQLPSGQSHSLEAQVVDICDEIAYNNHDLDDGLDSGFLTLEKLKEVELWQEFWERVDDQFPDASLKIKTHHCIRSLINEMVMDLIQQSQENISRFEIKTFEDVIGFHKKYKGKTLITFSEKLSLKIIQLKKFLRKNLYMHPEVEKMNERARIIIDNIFSSLLEKNSLLPKEYKKRIDSAGIHRSISDFIAGMTDRYAISFSNDDL